MLVTSCLGIRETEAAPESLEELLQLLPELSSTQAVEEKVDTVVGESKDHTDGPQHGFMGLGTPGDTLTEIIIPVTNET